MLGPGSDAANTDLVVPGRDDARDSCAMTPERVEHLGGVAPAAILVPPGQDVVFQILMFVVQSVIDHGYRQAIAQGGGPRTVDVDRFRVDCPW